jgi:hypothetical protein
MVAASSGVSHGGNEVLNGARLALVPIRVALPVRELLIVDHTHKHHGAACRAMLQLFEQLFPPAGVGPGMTR